MDCRRWLLIWLVLIYICLREHRPSLSRAGFITIVLTSTNYNLLLPKDFYTVPINFSHKWLFFRLGNKCWVRLSSLLKITQLVSDWACVVWLCSQQCYMVSLNSDLGASRVLFWYPFKVNYNCVSPMDTSKSHERWDNQIALCSNF